MQYDVHALQEMMQFSVGLRFKIFCLYFALYYFSSKRTSAESTALSFVAQIQWWEETDGLPLQPQRRDRRPTVAGIDTLSTESLPGSNRYLQKDTPGQQVREDSHCITDNKFFYVGKPFILCCHPCWTSCLKSIPNLFAIYHCLKTKDHEGKLIKDVMMLCVI